MQEPITKTIEDLKQAQATLYDTARNTLVNTPPATWRMPSPDVEPAPRFGDLFPGQAVHLVLCHKNHLIPVKLEGELVIGRTHFKTGYQPDVDLTPYEATLKGVSRSHVKITRSGDILYIEDLDSTNGTWLNGRPLTNGRRVLRDGDYLNLGHFEARVQLSQT